MWVKTFRVRQVVCYLFDAGDKFHLVQRKKRCQLPRDVGNRSRHGTSERLSLQLPAPRARRRCFQSQGHLLFSLYVIPTRSPMTRSLQHIDISSLAILRHHAAGVAAQLVVRVLRHALDRGDDFGVAPRGEPSHNMCNTVERTFASGSFAISKVRSQA